jgi:hypothetical protein
MPSSSSLWRWATNGTRRLNPTGNHESGKWRNGDLFLLVLYRLVRPKASAYEIIAFVANNSVTGRVYSRSDVTLVEQKLGFTLKKGSTTAYQALRPLNLLRRHLFHTRPYPAGHANIARNHVLDSDEAGLKLEGCNRTMGKAASSIRVREAGVYGHGDNYNLILVIDAGNFLHWELRTAKTDGAVYAAFAATALQALPAGGPRMT